MQIEKQDNQNDQDQFFNSNKFQDLEQILKKNKQTKIGILSTLFPKETIKEPDLQGTKAYFASSQYQIVGIYGQYSSLKVLKINRQFLEWRIKQTYKVSPIYISYRSDKANGFVLFHKNQQIQELVQNELKINKIQISKQVDMLTIKFKRLNNEQSNIFIVRQGLRCMNYLVKTKQNKEKSKEHQNFKSIRWGQLTQIFKNILYKSRLNKPLKKRNLNLITKLLKLTEFVEASQIKSIIVKTSTINNTKRAYYLVGADKQQKQLNIDECLQIFRNTLERIE